MTDILQLNLTREQATVIHGAVQLHMAEHHSNVTPDLAMKIARNVPKWTKQAELTEILVFDQGFGKLMRRISTFIDVEPPEKCSE